MDPTQKKLLAIAILQHRLQVRGRHSPKEIINQARSPRTLLFPEDHHHAKESGEIYEIDPGRSAPLRGEEGDRLQPSPRVHGSCSVPLPCQSPGGDPLHGRSGQPPHPKRRRTSQELSGFETLVVNTLRGQAQRPQDREEHFGMWLAATMRSLSPAKSKLLEHHILKCVCQLNSEDGR